MFLSARCMGREAAGVFARERFGAGTEGSRLTWGAVASKRRHSEKDARKSAVILSLTFEKDRKICQQSGNSR